MKQEQTVEKSAEIPLEDSRWIESTQSDYKADHLMTNEEIEVEEIGLGKEILIEDCPDIPNEVNDSIEL